MITFSIIQKSQLEGAARIDPEFYQIEYLRLLENIKKYNYQSLKEFGCKIVSGPFGSSLKSEAYLDKGVPFIRINDLDDFFINFDTLIYISDEDNNRLKQSQVFPHDLVLSKVGNTIGVVSAVPEEFSVCNISENNLGIKFNKDISSQEKLFILTFLNSKIGLLQVLRSISGNAQPKINIKDIEEIIFPIPQDKLLKEIDLLINNARISISESESYYNQAEDFLLEELGLKNAVFEDQLSYIVNFSNVVSDNRVDPDYFQPKYEKLITKLKDKDAIILPEVIENAPSRFNSYSKPDEQFKYVELSNINTSIGAIDGNSEVLGKEAPSRAKIILKAGDVILSSVEGSLGKVALVGKEQEGYLASTGFFQFRSKEILPEVLLVLGKSIVLQMQFQKYCAGTILTAVPNEALKQMYIPILPKTSQEKIAELVTKSHEARKRSKELLEEAKRKVEEMIDKSS